MLKDFDRQSLSVIVVNRAAVRAGLTYKVRLHDRLTCNRA